MGVNKFVYNNEVKFDLTGDTVTADKMASGTKAHKADGSAITGTLVVRAIRTGSAAPDDSVGNDNDIYIQIEG